MNDRSIYEKLKRAVTDRTPAVLATVIAGTERIPTGAKALYTLKNQAIAVEDGGGIANANGEDMLALVDDALTKVVGRDSLGALTFRGKSEGRVIVHSLPSEPEVRIAFEVFSPKPRLVIAGGGHIAVPTHEFAAKVGMAVTVMDDRPAFAHRGRFPLAEEVICDDFTTAVKKAKIDETTSVIVITRGHLHDLEVLRAMKGKSCAYLGMIGSKRRVLTVIEKLREEEGMESFIDRLYAPIGLDIGAESPEEIALAIVAEVVCVLRGGKGGHLRWRP